ncbi:MAG: nitroreductase family protein, partial [Chloroflexota bacterium]|nr:nitroreductase family protein [Chloroflexota bacterium]
MRLQAGRLNPNFAIRLPPPRLKSLVSLEEAIARRRSVRKYLAEPLTLDQVGQILWSAQGITGAGRLRTSPSAGAAYPLELFLLVGKRCVILKQNSAPGQDGGQKPARDAPETLQSGIYHYAADGHSLVLRLPGDLRQDLARAALD